MAYPYDPDEPKDKFEWLFPGVYSITVPYGMNNNFFYPAYVALMIILLCEFISSKLYKVACLTVVAFFL